MFENYPALVMFACAIPVVMIGVATLGTLAYVWWKDGKL